MVSVKPNSREFSDDFLKDPTRLNKVIDKYEKRVNGFLDELSDKIIDLIKNYSMEKEDEEEEKKVQATGDIGKELSRMYLHHTATKPLLDAVERLVITEYLNPAQIEAEWEVKKAYQQGFGDPDKGTPGFAGLVLGLETPPRQKAEELGKIAVLVEKQKTDFKGVGDATSARIRTIISEGIINSYSSFDIARDIRDTIETIGKTRSNVIVRTETQRALNEGAKDRYRREGVERVEWLTALDERTCTDDIDYPGGIAAGGCAGLNGERFDIEKAPPCPIHPNCRCTLLSVFDTREKPEEGEGEEPIEEEKKEIPEGAGETIWKPAETEEEARIRMEGYTVDGDVNLPGATKDNINSIDRAIHRVDTRLMSETERESFRYQKIRYVNENDQRERSAIAAYVHWDDPNRPKELIVSEKYLNDPQARIEKVQQIFRKNQMTELADIKEKIEIAKARNDVEALKRFDKRLVEIASTNRWTIDTSGLVDDPIEATMVHEELHRVYHIQQLETKWKTSLTLEKVTSVDRLAVSEYGGRVVRGSVDYNELFVETGSAIEHGIPIPENIKRAWLRTVGEAIPKKVIKA